MRQIAKGRADDTKSKKRSGEDMSKVRTDNLKQRSLDKRNEQDTLREQLEEDDLFKRFFQYVSLDTQSDETSGTHPSSAKQHKLAELLTAQLREMGVTDVTYDQEHCYVYAHIPGTGDLEKESALGFIAHMDTSPAVTDKDVKIRVIEHFNEDDPHLKTADFPDLKKQLGQTLIATDTTTLLGADDKAGVAEIMSMAAFFMSHPQVPHRPLALAFTPDEEIGEGPMFFDLKTFAAPQAYTVDGGTYGIVEYENFNAAAAVVSIKGKSTHPGDAKGKMINAALLASEFIQALPADERPETTQGYEGFFMVESVNGDVENAQIHLIVRDHDKEKFEARKAVLLHIADTMNEKYGKGTVSVALKDQYYNMASIMKDHMEMIDAAFAAIRAQGGEPKAEPIRGGTDGATLSFRGLPCPNLCTGGYNYHSRFEYASVPEMKKCRDLLIALAQKNAGNRT